ncbi:nucleotide exchange factor GrpE [Corynebacterium phocae]
MPNDPGNPENTDHESMTPNEAEAAAERAAEADEEPEIDPSLEADLEQALADVADVDVESGAEADAEPTEPTEPSVEDQLAERTEDLQRLTAEYTNYRRRTQRERDAAVTSTKAQVLSQFLPLLDDLELARQHGDLEEGPLKAFADKLLATVKSQKLEAFAAEGDDFDPEIHEAVQDLSDGEDQVVGTVLRRGYRVGDRLVRTAMVIIAGRESE